MLKQIIHSTIFVSALAASTSQAYGKSPFSEVTDFLKPANLKKEVKEEVAELSIGTGTTLVDADLAGAIGFSTRYRYEVEPSHNKGFYTRVDGWKLKMSLKPGDLIGGLDAPLFFSIDKGASVYFVRQFTKQKDALKALPYTFNKLPLTAKIAKEKLIPGDLVQIPTKMSLAFGASSGQLANNVNAGVSLVKTLSGEFFINIFRMKDNHVRVRIISKKANNTGANVGAGLEFNIFGVRIFDNFVERIIETDLAKVGFGKQKGEQFIVDYVFDLDSSDGIKAYNEILNSAYKFKDLEILKEFIKKNGLENRLFKVFDSSERLAVADQNNDDKRVERLFKGFNNYKGNNSRLKLGAIITSFDKGTVYRKNILAEEKIDGTRENYYFHTLTSNRGRNFGIAGIGFKEKANQTIFAMYPEKIETSESDMPDIGFIFNIKDSFLRIREQKYLNRDIKLNLPKYALDKLDWEVSNNQISNSNVNFEIYINASAFNNLNKISKDELYERFTKLWKTYEREGRSFGEIAGDVTTDTITFRNVNEYAEKKRATNYLYKIFFKKSSVSEKTELMMQLRKNRVFKRIGFAIIMGLLDEKQQEEFTYVNVKISGENVPTIYLKEGEINTPQVYQELRNLQNIIDGNSYSIYF